jgi:hypothetical protein
MSDPKNGFGGGILKGLKNLLFKEEETGSQPPPPAANPEPPKTTAPVTPVNPVAANADAAPTDKAMKMKVYQLLENMNKPGCDFFEVWNAATEMGGANSHNIKAAYTSLRFADNTLSKAKLVESGQYYHDNLKSVLQTETQKREQEKSNLLRQKEEARSSLSQTIAQLEQEIEKLQRQLQEKKTERDTLDEKYNPSIADIDAKIAMGSQSVNSVLAEMQDVLNIIQKDIN